MKPADVVELVSSLAEGLLHVPSGFQCQGFHGEIGVLPVGMGSAIRSQGTG